jgi:hypothetical protein
MQPSDKSAAFCAALHSRLHLSLYACGADVQIQKTDQSFSLRSRLIASPPPRFTTLNRFVEEAGFSLCLIAFV